MDSGFVIHVPVPVTAPIFRGVCVDLYNYISSPSIGTDSIESKRASKIMFNGITHQLAIIENY